VKPIATRVANSVFDAIAFAASAPSRNTWFKNAQPGEPQRNVSEWVPS
jgi:hypothetical protein